MDLARLDAAIQRVREAPHSANFERLAEFGAQARDGAGELVAGLITHRFWDIRVFAARTVGFIQ